MTENEAKEKWCPLVRFTEPGNYQTFQSNRAADGRSSNCIASDCMMWVLDNPLRETKMTTFPLDGEPVPPAGEGWALTSAPIEHDVYMGTPSTRERRFCAHWERKIDGQGHCGLIR